MALHTVTEVAQLQLVLKEVANELRRAIDLHSPMHSAHEGYAVLKEEVDELWDDVKTDTSKKSMRFEAIQIAAMAIRFVLDVTDKAPQDEREDEHILRMDPEGYAS